MQCLPAVVWFLALLTAGCAASRETRSSDETFFQPVKSIGQNKSIEEEKSVPAEKKPVDENGKASGKKNVGVSLKSTVISRADSLVRNQVEQDRRLDALAAQLKALELGRKEERASSTSDPVGKPAAVDPAPKSERATPSRTFAQAVQLYDARKYQSAMVAFEGLLKGSLSAGERLECAYFAGMSNFRLAKYDGAVKWLKMAAEAPLRKIESSFTLGRSYKRLGMSVRAKEMFERVVKESPSSDLAAAAREELKGLAR